jgi:hypothetical protein
MQRQIKALSSLNTPKTEPKPTRGEMHPKTIHTTTKSPDSGFKLGFADLPPHPPTIASAQNTPTRSQETSTTVAAPAFKFVFGTESNLSSQAQQMMESIREEAARIKAQMQMEKDNQDKKDAEAEHMFDGLTATGRKIAKPKAKAGRFSDVHMAQFKKMDSIANHPSSFRAKPGYTQPTAQSLKRSGSRAGLDEPERPRTAGKGTPSRIPPTFSGRPTTTVPFKSSQAPQSERLENPSPAKRLRRSEVDDVSLARRSEDQVAKPSGIPKSISSTLFSATKSSLARSGQSVSASPNNSSMIPRANSVKSMRASPNKSRPSSAGVSKFTSKLIEAQQAARNKPLPAPPSEPSPPAERRPSIAKVQLTSLPAPTPKHSSFSSKLPTFSGLKSILRSTRKASVNKQSERPGTPKRPNNADAANAAPPESMKKVDFTPSVKSRYAVKLAASSPAPARLPLSEECQSTAASAAPYDPAAYLIEDDGDATWEDASSPIEYPILPAPSSAGLDVNTFSKKAKDHERRESKEFKSIFTTLHPARPSPSTLTSVNTTVNTTSPAVHANKVMRSPSNHSARPSSSTIRRVRGSGVTNLVQPFEDTGIKTAPHGLPAKKRRRESAVDEDRFGKDDDAKENRRISHMPSVPGGWEDSLLNNDQENQPDEDEGVKRGGKRARKGSAKMPLSNGYEADAERESKVDVAKGHTGAANPVKKSAAREQAAKNAKARKSGVLSLSRLNVLSRPKTRG